MNNGKMGKKKHNGNLPPERQMLYILRSFTKLQDELVKAKQRVAELEQNDLGYINGQLKIRLERGQAKYDRLKEAYNQLLVVNSRRKEIVKSVWNLVPEDMRCKFERSDTGRFEGVIEKIDNENIV